MKLDKNINRDGRGKYGLFLQRRIAKVGEEPHPAGEIVAAIAELKAWGVLDFGDTPETEFFVIRLKDKYAAGALNAYAEACERDDPEFAAEVFELAQKAADYPNKKRPD